MNTNKFMLTLPVTLIRPLTCHGMICSSSPWGAPFLIGMIGCTPDNQNNKELVICHEWPIPVIETQTHYTKEDIENIHLRRLLNDYFFSKQSELFQSISRGSEPPDFFVSYSDEPETGLDLVQYTSEQRRWANARFEKIKSFILANYSTRLRNLRGYVIYFWWEDDNGLRNPEISDKQMNEVLVELEKYIPEPTIIQGNNLPEKHPGMHIGETKAGANFYAHPMIGSTPSTRLFFETGFELGLAFSTQIGVQEIWNEVLRLINKHDKAQITKLVITVGAPNRKGYGYLSDEYMMRIALANPISLPTLEHISSIYLHFWNAGEIHLLYPKIESLSPAVFPGGGVISHCPINGQTTTP